MAPALSLINVSYRDVLREFSCDSEPGSATLVVTSRQEEGILLTRLITGLTRPDTGTVMIDGRSVDTFGPAEMPLHRRQVGIVPAHGGLISNLKLWENITLPLLYHNGCVTADDEQLVREYLTVLEYTGSPMALPAHLSLHERRITTAVRAFVRRPRIMLYVNCFEDCSPEERGILIRAAAEFHSADAGRVSMYISSTADIAEEIPMSRIIHTLHVKGTTPRET